jgi:hypothetical protein
MLSDPHDIKVATVVTGAGSDIPFVLTNDRESNQNSYHADVDDATWLRSYDLRVFNHQANATDENFRRVGCSIKYTLTDAVTLVEYLPVTAVLSVLYTKGTEELAVSMDRAINLVVQAMASTVDANIQSRLLAGEM